ncbi:hypothetical protein DFJ43DRAFT_1228547 [Lentinula guzmanii]|uniref:Uncharacterized protein n=1 Tax=Lentinula guzmanii TaxID=2804957 RepID=A0AA38J2D3_9AGAR|nr:hypothetical protein DFJ43DRAFT_1228547 [Lentinula guzmanii]
MRFNVAYFVLGLASVAYAVPINSDGSASLPSLGARGSNEVVTFEFTTQHAAEANPNAISLSSLWGAKTQVSVKDPTAEKLAKEVVQDLFKTLGFTAQLKQGSVFGGIDAGGRIDYTADKVPGYESPCSGWVVRKGQTVNGELTGRRDGRYEVVQIENGKKVKQSE